MAVSSRDPHLVAVHRGGLLSDSDHRLLALWAGGCAARVLPLFEAEHPDDSRPAEAVKAAEAWAAGQCSVAQARSHAVAAHVAAREVHGAARLAARACGHAAATAHMADHELGAAFYALRALATASPEDLESERAWQLRSLPERVADLVRSDMHLRSKKFLGIFEGA